MVINFTQANLLEAPTLVLKNLDGTAIQVLGCANEVKAEICYNEISTITFEIPRFVNGELVDGYDKVVGSRIVEMIGWGQFFLVDPETANDGIDEIKSCKAYSLEYEFARKKMTIQEGTYNFWDPTADSETVLGIIMEYMPSWSIGAVDSALIGKYRTFSADGVSIYDFIKSTLQKTYNCIFDFDTVSRKVYVKHVDSDAEQSNVYLSLDNLISELDIKEDSENIKTVLDVNGAEGVDIRSVNPTGTNKIYNLDYFMNTGHFTQEMVDKWNAWKAALNANRQDYYNLTIERAIKTSAIAALEAEISENKDSDLAALYAQQATYIELMSTYGQIDFYVGFAGHHIAKADGVEPTPEDSSFAWGLSNREPFGKGYARQKVSIWDVVDGSGTGYPYYENTDSIVFPTCTEDWYVFSRQEVPISPAPQYIGWWPDYHWVLFDGEASKTPIAHGSVQSELQWEDIKAGDTVSFPAKLIKVSSDNLDETDQTKRQNILRTLDLITKLSDVKSKIDLINSEIADDEETLEILKAEAEEIRQRLVTINNTCAFSNFFTDEELLILDRYFAEDSIQESNFVFKTADSYVEQAQAFKFQNGDAFQLSVKYQDEVDQLNPVFLTDSEIYRVENGLLECLGVQANVISSVVEFDTNTDIVTLTAYLGSGEMNGNPPTTYDSATITVRGEYSAFDVSGNTILVTMKDGRMFFTRDVSIYEQHAIEWELYEYGTGVLEKLAFPTYTFDITSANFFALEEFYSFVTSISLGKRIYLDDDHGSVLNPILVKAEFNFEDISSLSLQFGNSYNLSDSAFHLVDLLEQSISMGKSVDAGRFNYNAFIDSGAYTRVREFMDGSLYAAKNSVVAGADQSITIDGSGFHARKRLQDGSYSQEEIAIINNSIVFTTDGWQSSRLAIGKFNDPNSGECWGVAAPSIVGTLIAGENLVIESSKLDGDKATFKVDGNGAILYNSKFEVVSKEWDGAGSSQSSAGRHIVIDPEVGFVIGKYPVLDASGNVDFTSDNPKFWVDMDGNVHIKGTLEGCDGLFTGSIRVGNNFTVDADGNLTALTGTFGGTTSGTMRWEDDTYGHTTATIGFIDNSSSNGKLISIETDGGISIRTTKYAADDSSGNIAINAAGSIWILNNASEIRIRTDDKQRFITLKNYIKGIVNGTIT